MEVNPTAAPVEAPTEIKPETGIDVGIERVGGVEGGVTGGVVGGIVGGVPEAPRLRPRRRRRRCASAATSSRRRRSRIVRPIYPPIAQSARVQGVVIIEATIGPDGKVQDARVLRSIPLLDRRRSTPCRQWEYTPTLLNGVPVPVIMTVTVQLHAAVDDPYRRHREPIDLSHTEGADDGRRT